MTEDAALREELEAALDEREILADIGRLVVVPSFGGDETPAQHAVAAIAERLGLQADLVEEDLDQLRHADGYPGEEVPRDRLVSLSVTLPSARRGPRLCFNGHVDVVPPGTEQWASDPFRASVRNGWLHGRGSADMKSGLVSALHAMAAVRRVYGSAVPGEVVLQSVAAEEDGGLGAFAALRRDADFAGCVIAEPTDRALVCAQAGALGFEGRIRGRGAHACVRLDGVSALDRFLPVYAALHDLEGTLNDDVTSAVMRRLPLPYPLSVGRVRAGTWSSSVIDELVFEGRVGVPVGRAPEEVRRLFEDAVATAADAEGPPPEITWSGGQFAPGETDAGHPFVALVADTIAAVTGLPAPLTGVPYGADMRLYCARGIPTVMYGPGDIRRAHAVDEAVPLGEVFSHVRTLARLASVFADRS
jgi:acetylornithine deacetylase